MLKSMRTLPALLLILGMLAMSTAAYANDDNNDVECVGDGCEEAGALLLTTTTGPTTTVAAGVAITVVLMMGGDNSASNEAYIRQNAVALQQDVTIGAGDSIDDLAAAFQVSEENIPAFAAALHAKRGELLPLTNVGELDAKRADAFFAIIANTMNQTPALHQDFQRIAKAS